MGTSYGWRRSFLAHNDAANRWVNAVNDNAIIVGWAKKIGELFPTMASYCAVYTNDNIKWCGLTVGYCMAVNGIRPVFGATDVDKFLYALAWKQFGTRVNSPEPGDVLVFNFGGSDNHVTLYEETQGDCYVCHGGNQSNEVQLSNYAITQCLGIYRPPAPSINISMVVSQPLVVKLNSGITATMFGGAADYETSAYDGHVITDTELGVALPYHFAGARPNVCVWKNGKSVICKIVDVGPWNTDDPYWQTGTRPEAESGISNSGKKTNLAGIDLTPAAASAIGIDGKGIVDWQFVDASEPGPAPLVAAAAPAFTEIHQLLNRLDAMKAGAITAPITSDANAATALAKQVELALLIHRVTTLIPAASAKLAQPGITLPVSSQDPTQQFVDIFNAVCGRPAGQQTLGQVNGALGQTIGNMLDGKKTAIGIAGAMLTAILQNVGPTISMSSILPFLSTAQGGAGTIGLGTVAMPFFFAVAAWGLTGKFEKWLQPPPK